MSDNCCFCGTTKGALIKLYQGWCCVKCFKETILKEEKETKHVYKKVPKPIFCQVLYCPNKCVHNENGACKKAPNKQRFTLETCPEYEEK